MGTGAPGSLAIAAYSLRVDDQAILQDLLGPDQTGGRGRRNQCHARQSVEHGNLLRAAGDPSAAEESYHQGLAVAKRQSAKLWELLGATSLARLWRDQGKRTDARDLIARVCGRFTEGFDTPVLQEAKALLDELA